MNTFKRNMVILIIALCIFFGAWYFYKNVYIPKEQPVMIATIIKQTQPLSAFAVSDDNGGIFTELSLRGQWTLLFFGYPKCPDICPNTLGIVRDTWNLYQPNKTPPAKFVFASLTSEPIEDGTLKTFVKNFNKDFVGISGSSTEMHQLSDQLGIYFTQQTDRIDHTASLMLINPQGKLTAVFTPPFTAEQVAKDLDLITNG